jgi:hypothetical protein
VALRFYEPLQTRSTTSRPPAGAGRVEEWENQGWDKDDAIAYLNAYYANLILPPQQIYLRSGERGPAFACIIK